MIDGEIAMIKALIALVIIGAFFIQPKKGYDSYNCNCLRATQHYSQLPEECK